MAITDNNPITENDYPVIASILVEALFFGDKQTATRYKISQRSINRYRKMMADNEKLSSQVILKKQQFEDNWVEEIPAAIRAGLRFLLKAAQEADHKNPETIHAVAGAMKIIAEIGLTKDVIDAKLGRYNLPDRAQD